MYAVIMAGGGGTRLWPLSRRARPKPFLPLLGDRSLLQATVARLSPLIEPSDVYVVTDARYAGLIAEQVPEVPVGNLLPEPVGRNTAAAVAYAVAAIDRPPDDVMVVLPADQRITDEPGFRDALASAGARAAAGDLVTLGITASGPETGYGYVVATGAPSDAAGMPSYRVERFVEKPDVDRARALLAAGNASWNAGIFVWRRDAVRAELAASAADILDAVESAVAGGPDAIAAAYPSIRSTSIDYALLEPASARERVAVVPAAVGWSDLGSWSALLDAAKVDGAEVEVHVDGPGEVVAVGSGTTLVHGADGRLIALVGVRDLVVVDTPDALLVCGADAAQDVKQVVDRLTADGRADLL
ncbi:MAG: mannose-1-phosphate guanylyltransferase [Chloroflexi bacterium]|nr:mannose-1-phosphate guanylyltransferase [Chloroflexota bacterium]